MFGMHTLVPAYQLLGALLWTALPCSAKEADCVCALQLYKQHFASEGGDDDEDEGDAVDGEGITDQLAPSVNKKRLVSPDMHVEEALLGCEERSFTQFHPFAQTS